MDREAAQTIAIVGGGCAGLSLGVTLLERGLGERRLHIVEPRQSFRRDRTWCYWDIHGHLFEEAVAHRWWRWQVVHGGRSRIQASSHHPYCEIPADRFYAHALARLTSDPRVTVELDTRAQALVPRRGRVQVVTDRGAFEAGRVFDGRPPGSLASGTWLQHFVGWRVRTETEVFDPETATLMDFDVSQEDGIQFLYVLPYAADHALVEATFLSGAPLPPEHYATSLRRYLERRYGVEKYEVLDTEAGAIPLSTERPPGAQGRIIPIGTRGRWVRPSTGYAFLAIQRQSARLAEALASEGLDRIPPTRTRLQRVLDSVFLARLRRDPRGAPALFARLFERVPADRLVRFLSGCTEPGDTLAVIRALPTLPMLGAAWSARGEAWRA